MATFLENIPSTSTTNHGAQPVALTVDWMKDSTEAKPMSDKAQALKERLASTEKKELTKAELEEKLARAEVIRNERIIKVQDHASRFTEQRAQSKTQIDLKEFERLTLLKFQDILGGMRYCINEEE